MSIYGYCRISKPTQSITRQVENILKVYPTAQIIEEAYTGTKVVGRKGFEKLIKTVKKGDTIIFDSVSRMSRNADEGTQTYFELNDKGVSLVFLKEPYINTDTYNKAKQNQIPSTGTKVDVILKGVNEFLIELQKEQIRIAFEQAEKEVKDLQERTKEGLRVARANGKQIGQKEGNTLLIKKKEPVKELIQKYSKDFYGTNTDKEVISIINGTDYHISRNTYYKYKRELTEQ